MLLLFVVLLSASVLADAARLEKRHYSPDDAEMYFEYFMNTYQKQYESETEKKLRFEIFKQNLEQINQKNAKLEPENRVHGITKFTDLTQQEFKEMYTGLKISHRPYTFSSPTVDTSVKPPDSFDWRDHNAVTPVKDQGQCGSCWTFSATGAIEGAYAIKHKQILSFSEQQIVSCDQRDGDLGCNGGEAASAMSYIMQNCSGIELEDDYPYTGRDDACTFDASKVKAKVTGIQSFNLTDDDMVMQSLYQYGPISIAIDGDDFQTYGGGVLVCNEGPLGHAVLLVGYGTEKATGKKYWIIKNSWGDVWGEAGYARVARQGNPCGMKNAYGYVPQVA